MENEIKKIAEIKDFDYSCIKLYELKLKGKHIYIDCKLIFERNLYFIVASSQEVFVKSRSGNKITTINLQSIRSNTEENSFKIKSIKCFLNDKLILLEYNDSPFHFSSDSKCGVYDLGSKSLTKTFGNGLIIGLNQEIIVMILEQYFSKNLGLSIIRTKKNVS